LNRVTASRDAFKAHPIVKQTKKDPVLNSVTASRDTFRAQAIVKQTKKTPD